MTLNLSLKTGKGLSSKVEKARIEVAEKRCKRLGVEIYEPEAAIRKAVSQFGDALAVSCSWGSCSVAVLEMALKIKPDITIIFDDTTVEYPQTYEYRDLILREWNLQKQYVETKPLMPFWDVWKKFGAPFPRGGKGRKRKPACCHYCKDEPFCIVARKRGIQATLTGIRAAESWGRFQVISHIGQYYCNKHFHGIWRIHPIAFWTQEETKNYLIRNNIPLNAVYTELGLPRNGCQPCTGFKGWERQLAITNPKMYAWIQKTFFKKPTLLLYDTDLELAREDEAVQTACEIEFDQATLEEWF